MDYYNFTDPLALILQEYEDTNEEKVESTEGQVENKGNLTIQKKKKMIFFGCLTCYFIKFKSKNQRTKYFQKYRLLLYQIL